MGSVEGEERNRARIFSCTDGVGCWESDTRVHQDRREVYLPATGVTTHILSVYCGRSGEAEEVAVADVRTNTALPGGCLIRGNNMVCSGWS